MNTAFVAWSNFTDPAVYRLWVTAFARLFLLLVVAWSVGDLVVSASASSSAGDDTRDDASDALVVRVWAGLAVGTLALFVLGLMHLYRPVPIAVVAAGVVAGRAGRRRTVRSVIDPVVGVWRAVRAEPWLWAFGVVCSLPALLPPYRWDEGSYQLAQAEQWVQAGWLTVDPFLRYPLNAANWQLLQGVALMLGGPSVVHLLTWLTGVLTTLVVMLIVRRAGAPRVLAYVAALAFFVTPLVQEQLTVGMTDIPLMGAFAASVYLLTRTRIETMGGSQIRPYGGAYAIAGVVAAGLVAGMFVGMKILGLLYLPLFLGLAGVRVSRAAVGHGAGRALTVYGAALVLASAPWYVRSAVLVGDPIPPVVAGWRGVESPYWSRWDREAQAGHLRAGLSWAPTAVARVPLESLVSTDGGLLRGWPLLGYILLFPVSLFLVAWVWSRGVWEVWTAAWYGAIVWIATTYHLRYAVFLPLAAACAAMVIAVVADRVAARARRARARDWVAAVLGIGLLLGPTPAAARYIRHAWTRRIPTSAAERAVPGQADSAATVALTTVRAHVPIGAPVYLVHLAQLKYYLEADGYRAIGDDFHDGRWTDFWRLLDADRADSLLRRLPADYVVLTRAEPTDRRAQWHATLATLVRTATLAPVMVDSGVAIFRVR